MASLKRKQDWISLRVSGVEDAALIEMLKATLDHMDHGFLTDGPLLSLEREYRQQTNGAAVNSLRDVELAVLIELAIRYSETK